MYRKCIKPNGVSLTCIFVEVIRQSRHPCEHALGCDIMMVIIVNFFCFFVHVVVVIQDTSKIQHVPFVREKPCIIVRALLYFILWHRVERKIYSRTLHTDRYIVMESFNRLIVFYPIISIFPCPSLRFVACFISILHGYAVTVRVMRTRLKNKYIYCGRAGYNLMG